MAVEGSDGGLGQIQSTLLVEGRAQGAGLGLGLWWRPGADLEKSGVTAG